MVEFALVAMTFFFLVFALMDFSWLMFNQMNMQDVVRQAGRYASTGQQSTSGGVTLSRNASIDQMLRANPVGANIDSWTIAPADGSAGTGAGAPAQTMRIIVNCDVPLLTNALASIFPNDKFTFTVSTTYKNEPFSPTLTSK